MKFSVVTPCRNAEALIAETVSSLIHQRGLNQHELQYIVVDGASTDGTLDVVSRQLDAANDANIDLTIVSEPDNGMYDALAKGLALANGEMVSYLNAGDYYVPFALDTVSRIAEKFDVAWLTGMRVKYNDFGDLIRVALPPRHRTRLIKTGFYGGRGRLGFIQQESTFWSRSLNQSINFAKLSKYRLAGDAYLWSLFADECDLVVVEAVLGGHRQHYGQLSENLEAYREEMMSFLRPPNLGSHMWAVVDQLTSYAPRKVRRALMQDALITWRDHDRQWVRGLI